MRFLFAPVLFLVEILCLYKHNFMFVIRNYCILDRTLRYCFENWPKSKNDTITRIDRIQELDSSPFPFQCM